MGYESTLYLVGVSLAPEHRSRIEERLSKPKRQDTRVAEFLSLVALTSEGTLEFKHAVLPMPEASEDPDDEGLVGSAVGKWYRAEDFARWLCRHGFEGSIIQHSREGDGAAWGWEFRKGRMRCLELRPSGRWEMIAVR